MITNLNCKDMIIVNDLVELDKGIFHISGEEPFLEITNLPKGLIQEINILLKDYDGILEIYFINEDEEDYSKSKMSTFKTQ